MGGDERLGFVRDQALEVARGWSGPEAPPGWALTAALFERVADDDVLVAQAAEIPADRIPALLFVAAVQAAVARHPDAALRAYYPPPLGEGRPVDASLGDALRAFCEQHHDEVAALSSSHRYQMNEVARCTQIALALGVLGADAPGRPVALIDLGTGSGVGLYPDRYRYDLGDERVLGAADAPVTITCRLDGGSDPPLFPLPTIAARTGIDLHPIDVRDPSAGAWLAACVPPVPGAWERLDAASAVVASGGARIVEGDAVAALPEVLDAVPDELVAVVIDAYTAVFFDEATQRHLHDLIAATGRRRDVAWISLDPLVPLGIEASRSVQGIAVPEALVAQNRRGGVFALLSMITHLDGSSTERLLATAHPSGTVMTWLEA